MTKFSDFNIDTEKTLAEASFVGEKIKIAKILDKEISVEAFRIEDSKVFKEKADGKCLHMQIVFNNEKRVVFTSARALISDIQKIPENGFPFKTVIKEREERYIFT